MDDAKNFRSREQQLARPPTFEITPSPEQNGRAAGHHEMDSLKESGKRALAYMAQIQSLVASDDEDGANVYNGYGGTTSPFEKPLPMLPPSESNSIIKPEQHLRDSNDASVTSITEDITGFSMEDSSYEEESRANRRSIKVSPTQWQQQQPAVVGGGSTTFNESMSSIGSSSIKRGLPPRPSPESRSRPTTPLNTQDQPITKSPSLDSLDYSMASSAYEQTPSSKDKATGRKNDSLVSTPDAPDSRRAVYGDPPALGPDALTYAPTSDESATTAAPTESPHHKAQEPELVVPTTNELTVTVMSELRRQGFPVGLAMQVGNTVATYPLRFWLVDNSGSMLTADGHQLRFHENDDSRTTVVNCTRWTELAATVEDHAKLAGLVQVSTVFRMLNDPRTAHCPQEFAVADPAMLQESERLAEGEELKKRSRRHFGMKKPESSASFRRRRIAAEVQRAVDTVHKTRPAGGTPLAPHLLEFRQRIVAVENQLRQQSQQAVIVIATDGLPTDTAGDETEDAKEELVEALKSFQNLPVWVVIRLCTDNKKVVNFYNTLDQMLELPLEVCDDFLGESKEIHEHNPWLNYALPLHRMRESGFHHRIVDLLDERLLTKDELHEFLIVLFGEKAMQNAPNIHSEWPEYNIFLSCINRAEGKHWRTHSRKTEHWIDMRRLNKMFGDRRHKWFSSFGSSRKLKQIRRDSHTADDTAYCKVEL